MTLSFKKSFIYLSLLGLMPSFCYAELSFNDDINFFGNNHIDVYQSVDEENNQLVDMRLDNRFISSYLANNFKGEFHLLTSVANYKESKVVIPINLPIENDRTNLFRLTKTFETNNYSITNRIDRLKFTYYDSNIEATIGRTALTWSRGRTFHVTDFFNPQNPGFYDTTYKIGTDMAYLNWSVSENSYISIVANPKRNSYIKLNNDDNDAVTWQDSTFATRYIYNNSWGDVSLIIGQYLEDYTIGGGFSYGLSDGMVIRADISFWSPEYDRNDYQTMLMLGLERGYNILAKNVTLFGEYYHNDFGTRQSKNSLHAKDLNSTMQRRMLELDTYLIGKNYISIGALVELSSYWNFNYTNMLNTDDGSIFNFVSLTYIASNAVNLSATIGQSIGDMGDDFGDYCSPDGDSYFQMETIFMVGLSIAL